MSPLFSTRRQFLQAGSAATMATMLAPPFTRRAAAFGLPPLRDHHVRATLRAQFADAATMRDLAMRAIDVAKRVGATYADARLTRTVFENFIGGGLFLDHEGYGIGVRALVNGAWGFAASCYWDPDEAEQLAHAAVAQARINAKVSTRPVDMGHYPVATGSWSTPIRIDPFQISLEEKTDFVLSLGGLLPTHLRDREFGAPQLIMDFQRQEQAVATTEGAYFTQTLYSAEADLALGAQAAVNFQTTSTARLVSAGGLAAAGAGWELLLDANLREQLPRMADELSQLLHVPERPVEIGRYDLVCDAATMAALVNATLADATQLDRALGYEANAGGTSYLGPDPFKFLGGPPFGTSLLNVRGDRSMPRGLATVKWDLEGVEPESFDLVSQGVLVDYQTTREQAAWLAPWYQRRGRPVRSHGCADATSALDLTMQCAPNLTLTPGTANLTFEDFVANTKHGYAFMNGQAGMDFQGRSGSLSGFVREIVNGKLGAIVTGAGVLFDSTHLWKSLEALGGAQSRATISRGGHKGQPDQTSAHSITAIPGVLKNMVVVDMIRRS